MVGSHVRRALRSAWDKVKKHPLSRVGPGLITGVADDDPSGIATYSQAGAQFGANMLWTMPLAFPLMAAIQSMCAQIGRVTGQGLAANIKTVFSPVVLRGALLLLLVANTLNIAADIAAMGEAAELVTGIARHIMTIVLAVVSLILQVFVPYHRYVFYLKWLTISLLAYVGVLFAVHIDWSAVIWGTLWPHITFNADTATVVTGVFGTTISPYLFFWQASEEVEDMRLGKEKPLLHNPEAAPVELRRIRWDTWSGMFYSDSIAYFIILAAAVTLHVAGITDIQTAAQAATALRPIAGDFAYLLFTLGILGVGLIGVPVLAGSGAYAMSEAMGWEAGLEHKATNAKGFYSIITISMVIAIIIQYSPISPMKALFWSAVINGVAAVPLMVLIILLCSRKSVMGDYTTSKPLIVLGWIATLVMAATAIGMFVLN